ncbi:MAG: LysR family transcriptional regulator [Mogibacterium sp.]|nr:LysR family transcriptional regulator [Mogibacterium sp.]
MISRFEVFCKVVEEGNFTRAGEKIGYSQSAVSQAVRGLERELGVVLLERRKDGIVLTRDGEEFYPYILRIRMSEDALEKKRQEMHGLENRTVRIGAFTSVTRNRLLPLMRAFKERYPSVTFELLQGDYETIVAWIEEGTVDFGFADGNAVSGYESLLLYKEEMQAVFRAGHPYAGKERVTLEEIAREPFILIDEGEFSEPLLAFRSKGIEPEIAYRVTDDYTILEMVRQGFGAAMLYPQLFAGGIADDLTVLPIKDAPVRPVTIIWRNWETLPLASRRFISFIGAAYRD